MIKLRSYGLILDSIVLIYVVEELVKYKVSMGLHLFFWANFPGTTFIQGAKSILDSRVNTIICAKKSFK